MCSKISILVLHDSSNDRTDKRNFVFPTVNLCVFYVVTQKTA